MPEAVPELVRRIPYDAVLANAWIAFLIGRSAMCSLPDLGDPRYWEPPRGGSRLVRNAFKRRLGASDARPVPCHMPATTKSRQLPEMAP